MLSPHKLDFPDVTFLPPPTSNHGNVKIWLVNALVVSTRTEYANQNDFYPFAIGGVFVFSEEVFGTLSCVVVDVPPQPNSPPKSVPGCDLLRIRKRRT